MRIFVPTRARIGKQITRRKFFLDQVPYRVSIIVPESERDAYIRAHSKTKEILVVPDEFKLSDIRQWVVDEFRDDPRHCFFDDDLDLLRRKAPTDVHMTGKTTLKDALECFQRIEYWFDEGYVHGSLSQRSGNNTVAEAFKLVGRSVDAHFYDANVIHNAGIKINAVVLRQDFHTTLSLLELGYPNVIDYEFICGQSYLVQPGGCQVYRTHEMLEQQAYLLQSLHPKYVTVTQKERVGGFGVSTDVRMAWRKAYEDGKANKG